MGTRISLLIIWRKLRHNKVFSILNVLGLGIGLSVAVIVFLYASYELSFDRFNENSDHIYLGVENSENLNSVFPLPLAETIRNEIPEVEVAANVLPWEIKKEITTANGEFLQSCFYMDEGIFDIFSFWIIQQSQNTIFPTENSVAICESLANKLFGSVTLAIGKDITVDKKNTATISAIFKDIPNNSSLRFEMAAPLQTGVKEFKIVSSWNDAYFHTFAKLKSPINQVKPKISAFAKQHDVQLEFFPLTELHFAQSGSKQKTTLYIAIFAGVFIMLLACINFVNLSTAHIFKNAREAGLNKLFGSSSFNLHRQFILEALMLTFIAFGVALLVSFLLLPYINRLIGISLSISQLTLFRSLLLLAIISGISFFTAIIPAHIFSKAQPLHIFNKQISTNQSAVLLRKSLLMLQLSLTIIIIISTLLIGKQVHFIDQTNLGFDKENMVFIESKDIRMMASKFSVLEKELLKSPIISSVCATDAPPGVIGSSTTGFRWQENSTEKSPSVYMYRVSNEFVNTFRVKLLEGKGFDKVQSNTKEVLINKTLAHLIAQNGSALNKVLYQGERPFTIIGVIDDFSFNSIKEKQQPGMILFDPSRGFYPCVRISNEENTSLALAQISKTMKELFPDMKYDIKFTDDFILDEFISREIRFSKFFTLFSALGIIVCSMGLFGLALFESNKRIKEIGIRKVNGAHAIEVITMLNKDIITLTILAFAIATPIAWYAMNKWLENFAYKTELSWWIFALAGLLALGIALLTVSWQSWKAATRNPVEALRYE
jgi:putative ABC transport system permease protein